MFVVVDMSNSPKRIFEKFRHHEIELKRYDVKGCAPFFVARCHRDYTDFAELKAIIERYGVALLPDGEAAVKQLAPLEFVPTVLPLKMLVKTVGEYFCSRDVRCDLAVTVIDKSAKVCDVLPILAKNVRYVRVITSRYDRYEMCAEDIFNSYGISIDVSDDLSVSYGSDMIISLDDKELASFDCGKIICFKKYTQNPNVFTLSQSDLLYKKFDSEKFGIDKFTFVCALYETCGYYLSQIPVFKDINELSRVLQT